MVRKHVCFLFWSDTVLYQTVSMPALCSVKRHRTFQDCKQNCPLLLRQTLLCLPKLFAIEISLKREFRTKDSQHLTHNMCKDGRDPWKIVFQQPHALNQHYVCFPCVLRSTTLKHLETVSCFSNFCISHSIYNVASGLVLNKCLFSNCHRIPCIFLIS